MSRGFEKILARLETFLAIDDSIARARAIGHAYIEFGLADPQTYKLIFMEELKHVYSVLGPGERCGRRPIRATRVRRAGVDNREAVARGLFKPVDPELAGQAYRAGVHGTVRLDITCPRVLADASTVAATIEDALIAGLPA